MFRGKPAITKFDRLITPSRKSSQSFATPTGAALGRKAPSACSRLAHPASGLTQPTLLCCLRLPTVRLAGRVNLLAHYAKGTLSPPLQSLRPTPGFAPAARRRLAAPLPSRYSTLPTPEVWSLGGRCSPGFGRGAAYFVAPKKSALGLGRKKSHQTPGSAPVVSSSSRFPYRYLVSTSLRLPEPRSGPSGALGPLRPSHGARFPSVMGGVCRA